MEQSKSGGLRDEKDLDKGGLHICRYSGDMWIRLHFAVVYVRTTLRCVSGAGLLFLTN